MSSEALLADSKNERDTDAVSGGSFVVTQTHLGFCPADVKLEIRKTGLVLLDDEHMVMSYPFTDMVMWSQSRAEVTIMLMRNLRRLVFIARSHRHAKRIVLKMHEVTDSLKTTSPEASAGIAFGFGSKSDFHDSRGQSEQTKMKESGAAMFRVQQTHLEDAPDIVMLIIDETGLRLLDRETGKLYHQISWFQLLLWRADAGAVVLILNRTNQQIELMTTSGTPIAKAMTAHALAVREALSEETVERSRMGNIVEYPRAPLEFRRELMQFEPHQGDGAGTNVDSRRRGCSGWMRILFGVAAADSRRVHEREQIHAIFSAVDRNNSGTIDLGELAALLRSFNIYNESTNRELSTNEMQLLMIEMNAFNNEVTLDGFATWVTVEDTGQAVASKTGHDVAARFKSAVQHRMKEAQAVADVFDKIDTDHDGLLDRTDFRRFCDQSGQEISEAGFYRAWASLDHQRNGQITFKDFFTWFKSDTFDAVTSGMVRAIRITRLMTAAKGAMVYAVDRRNGTARQSLRAMFDAMDHDCSGDVGLVEMLTMVDDLAVPLSDKAVHAALTEMNSTGSLGGSITFNDMEMWWCEPPNDTRSGILRSIFKFAAFRAKAAGAVLLVDNNHAGAESAELYINEALAAAYKPATPLHGKSLGTFGTTSAFRKWCQSVIYNNQAMESVLVVIVAINIVLLASHTGTGGVLPYYNFLVMVVFTVEAAMRIIVKGLYFAKDAYLSSWSWDAYDFLVLLITWAVFLLPSDITDTLHLTSNMYLFPPDGTVKDYSVDWLSLVRSFRVLRFFAQIRNIIAAVGDGRVMMASIVFLLFYLSVMFFVLGYQMYHGAASSQCLPSVYEYQKDLDYFNSTCVWGGQASPGPDGRLQAFAMCNSSLLRMEDTGFECPSTLNCERCAQKLPNKASMERLEHTDRYGFDEYGASILTLMALLTCDDWEKFTAQYATEEVLSKSLSWPFFFVFVVIAALFFVNLFVSGLAYSFIQIRADSRAKRERDRLKKVMVDTALQEGKIQTAQKFHKHLLQLCMPKLTRKAKDILIDPKFADRMRKVLMVNLLFMMMDNWSLANAKQQPDYDRPENISWHIYDAVLSGGDVFFTLAYSYEIMVKLQAIGFKMYFRADDTGVLMNNVIDAMIVITAWPETLVVLSDVLNVSLLGDVDSESLSSFKILRAFRVMKLVFIMPAVQNLMMKAFKGLDTILSLVMLIVLVLTFAALVGMNLFRDCQTEVALADGTAQLDAHTPNFGNFKQALAVAFQVMTADDWSPLMFKYMDCTALGPGAGYISGLYFISLVTLCYFILSNLFIAIFIENFKLDDEVKREMQVKHHIQNLTVKSSGTDSTENQWVQGMREGFEGIENMMKETSTINVLRRRTANEFMRGARVTGKVTSKATTGVISAAQRLAGGDVPVENQGQTNCHKKLAICCRCCEKYRPRERYDGISQTDRIQNWKMKALSKSGTLSPANGAWKERPFHRTLQANRNFQRLVYLFIALSALQTMLSPPGGAAADNTPSSAVADKTLNNTLDFLLLVFFALEFTSMTIAYGILGGPVYSIWPYKTTVFELCLLVAQVLTLLTDGGWVHFFAASVQPFRVVRYMYMIDGFRVQVVGLGHAIVSVWTALFLLSVSFLFFGIIGMELFKGKLHTCDLDNALSENMCWPEECILKSPCTRDDPKLAYESCIKSFCLNQNEGRQDHWTQASFNFDDMSQAIKSLASVWSLAGWTQLYYAVMDAPDSPGEAPSRDNNMGIAFLYFFSFILINSFLLTKLVTSMLCDFFAQKSGSDKTTDQRNWNFMSIFLVDALKLEVIKPPEKNRLGGLGLESYKIIHRHEFKTFIDVVVVLSVLATFTLQQMDCFSEVDLSLSCALLYTLDTLVLFVFWIEFALTLASVGRKLYVRNYQIVAVVLVTMSLDFFWRILQTGDESEDSLNVRKVAMWLHTANCLRALRVVTVLKRVNSIKKIIFLVGVAADKVLTLFVLMALVFIIFAFFASTLCHDVAKLDDGAINHRDNFDDPYSAMFVLWQICTGQSMMGANRECAEWYRAQSDNFPELRYWSIYAFFVVFFFVANMMFLNLFIALLLDFDLMGSEDMAVSDTDILLFKKFWCDNETGKGDIASGRLAQRRTIHSAIHLHELKDFVMGAADRNVGTFSMMPRLDAFYFNRVLYELKKSQEDVVASESGLAVHTIQFFDLLYALCHIRFSSSCLSLAEEVQRSLEMVEYIENHAAKVIQVGARAFCARRSVNNSGQHSPPGCVWPVENKSEDVHMVAMPHADEDIGRCQVCTLPNQGNYMWCNCAARDFSKEIELMGLGDLEEQQRSPRSNSVYKLQWDVSVNCALLFELHSLIQTERLTPEHLVAAEFDRQTAKDRKKQTGFAGMITANTNSENRLTLCLTRGMRQREEKIEMLQLRGQRLMRDQDWQGAATLFADTLDLDPDNFEEVMRWKEECERKHRTVEAKSRKQFQQRENRHALVLSKDRMGKSMDTKTVDSDLDQAPLIAAVRAVFSLPYTTVVTNFSHMATKEDRRLVEPRDFMKGLVELASTSRSTLTRNQIEALMRTIDRMPCSNNKGGNVHYRTFADMVCNRESLNKFCDAVVYEGVVLKGDKRKLRKGKKGKGTDSDDKNSMFGSVLMMTSLDIVMSQDSMQGGSSLDEEQQSDEEVVDWTRFYCPLTKQLMVDPVIASDGHSYERYAFADYWSDHGQTVQALEKRMSPVTGELLTSEVTEPNHALRKEIAAWKTSEELRQEKQSEKQASIQERTKRLRQESDDMEDLDVTTSLEPPSMFAGSFASRETKEGPGKKLWGVGWDTKELDFDEHKESFQKFSNPMEDFKATANPLVFPTGDAADPGPFETERRNVSLAVFKRSGSRDGDRNTSSRDSTGSQDGSDSKQVHANPMKHSMTFSSDSSNSADGPYIPHFEIELGEARRTSSKKTGRGKDKGKKTGGKLAKLNPLSMLKQTEPEVIAKYKALHNTPCYEAASLESEMTLGGVYTGDVISVTARVRTDGTIRVQSDRGWASVADPDGELNLELVDEPEYWYLSLTSISLRETPDQKSTKVSFLLKDTENVALTHKEIETEIENGEVKIDVWLEFDDGKGNVGWASLKNEEDELQLRPADPFDELRFQLRKLSLEALIRQAVSIKISKKQVAKATNFNRCVDPRNALIEMIKDLYEVTSPVLDLKELPPGWDGSETGRLAEGERVKVNAFGALGLRGKDADIDQLGADVKALHDKRGYVLYELPLRGLHGSYEVKIDRIRRTVVLPRENLIRQEDEKANKGLFSAVLANDLSNLRKLLERVERPSDALDRSGVLIPRVVETQTDDKSDLWRAEPGVLRVVNSVNTNDRDFDRDFFDKTLFEVACIKAAEQHEPLSVKLMLMQKLLIKAVVCDDLDTTMALVEEDDQLYTLDMLRTACSTNGPWATDPPTAVMALARRIWKVGGYGHHGGMANTFEAAEHLGGRCWLYLSKTFNEEFAEEFDPEVHTLEKLQQTHGALSSKAMKRRFGAKEGVTASEEQTERMLEWKLREFS